MTFEEFQETLNDKVMPKSIAPGLQVLWLDAKGEWDKAHDICGQIKTEQGAHLHAYLHRVEGDLSNAAYWYNRANRPVSDSALKAEWKELAHANLI